MLDRDPETGSCSTLQSRRGVRDPDFRTRIRQDSAHFEQIGSDPATVHSSARIRIFEFHCLGIWCQHNHKKSFCKDL